jgi:pimeloyl-ACP methyl ester carboxylesterase
MPDFDSNGARIHYEVFGEGKPIVLVHGFGVSLRSNWVATGWIDVLSPLRQVIALDCRGHGESDRPLESTANAADEMTDDVVRLMDHLGVATADIFGYSMGAGIALRAVVRHAERFTSAVLGGFGFAQPRGAPPDVAAALLAPIDRAQLEAIPVPVLIVHGAKDALAPSAREIAALIPGARLIELAGKEHITAVADQQFKETVVAFLKEPAAVR